MKKEKILEFAWLIVVIGLFVVSIKLIRSGELEAYVASFGIWAPIAVFILKISTLVIAPLGGFPLYVIAGALFGSWYGFLICFIADVVGTSICFLLSRHYGTRVLGFFVGAENMGRVERIVNIVHNKWSFVRTRLLFSSSPEFFAYGVGLTRVSFWFFFIINLLFIIPIDLLSVFLGSKIATLTSEHTFLYIGVLLTFGVLAFWFLYKDYQKAEGM